MVTIVHTLKNEAYIAEKGLLLCNDMQKLKFSLIEYLA